MRRVAVPLLALAALGIYGLFLLISAGYPEAKKMGKSLVFYTCTGATTAQAPFWAAVRGGWMPGLNIETQFWKDLDDLRSTMLAGKGDVWVGHTEGFAQAAAHGAPVTLIAVTAWRKFYFLTADPHVATLEDLSARLARTGERLAVAPPDSPAIAILHDLQRRGGPSFKISRHMPMQLALEAIRGTVNQVIAPEPLATMLMIKRPELRVHFCLEEEYSRRTGGNGMLPLAGVAVRTSLLRTHPVVVARLVEAMRTWADRQTEDSAGNAVLSVLPDATLRELGTDTIRRSLRNDPLRVVPAWKAREDVLSYLSVVLPKSPGGTGKDLPPSFFMEKP